MKRKTYACIVIARYVRGWLVRRNLKKYMREKIEYQLGSFEALRERTFHQVIMNVSKRMIQGMYNGRERRRQEVRMLFLNFAIKVGLEYLKQKKKSKVVASRYMLPRKPAKQA